MDFAGIGAEHNIELDLESVLGIDDANIGRRLGRIRGIQGLELDYDGTLPGVRGIEKLQEPALHVLDIHRDLRARIRVLSVNDELVCPTYRALVELIPRSGES